MMSTSVCKITGANPPNHFIFPHKLSLTGAQNYLLVEIFVELSPRILSRDNFADEFPAAAQ